MERYRLRQGVVLTEICGEYLLVATPQAKPYCKRLNSLNRTGGQIIRFLDRRSVTISEICDWVEENFAETDRDIIQGDVTAFMDDMERNGYIVLG